MEFRSFVILLCLAAVILVCVSPMDFDCPGNHEAVDSSPQLAQKQLPPNSAIRDVPAIAVSFGDSSPSEIPGDTDSPGYYASTNQFGAPDAEVDEFGYDPVDAPTETPPLTAYFGDDYFEYPDLYAWMQAVEVVAYAEGLDETDLWELWIYADNPMDVPVVPVGSSTFWESGGIETVLGGGSMNN